MTGPDLNDTASIDRRSLLSVLVAGTAGIAGCSGGGGGSGGGDGSGDGGSGGDGGGDGGSGAGSTTPTAMDTTTGGGTATTTGGGGDLEPLEVPDSPPSGDESFCAALMEAPYERYDESESPYVATFEYPAGDVGGVVATASANFERSLTIRATIDGQPMDIFPTMNMEGSAEQTPAMLGEPEGLAVVGGIDYEGETLPVVRARGGGNGDDGATLYVKYPYYVVGIPYDSTGKYHRYDFRATVRFSQDLEHPVCEATWEAVARRMVASLEPNPDTTIESKSPP